LAGFYVCAGAALGGAYLGALWLALRQLSPGRHGAGRRLGGALFRTGGAAVLLFLLTRGAPGPLLFALVGFLAVRSYLLYAIVTRDMSWS
jgi:hypothetical protein